MLVNFPEGLTPVVTSPETSKLRLMPEVSILRLFFGCKGVSMLPIDYPLPPPIHSATELALWTWGFVMCACSISYYWLYLMIYLNILLIELAVLGRQDNFLSWHSCKYCRPSLWCWCNKTCLKGTRRRFSLLTNRPDVESTFLWRAEKACRTRKFQRDVSLTHERGSPFHFRVLTSSNFFRISSPNVLDRKTPSQAPFLGLCKERLLRGSFSDFLATSCWLPSGALTSTPSLSLKLQTFLQSI